MWMLLHGFMGSPMSWERVLASAALPEEPVVPALVGHAPNWTHVRSFEGETARLSELATGLGPPRCLCGYSMGARVALGILARVPKLFDAAVLIGLHPGLSNDVARSERRAVDTDRARQLRRGGLASFVKAWEGLPLFESQRALPEDVLAIQRKIRLGHDAEGLAHALEVIGLAEMPDYRRAVSTLDIPITLMAGSQDAKFSRIARELAAAHPHVHADIVDGAGHNPLLEAPGAVARALNRAEQRAEKRPC